MFKNSHGQLVNPDNSIIPLVSYLPDKKIFKCLGTDFFINPVGGFVTAKHVLFDNQGKHVPTLYGIQSLSNGVRLIRRLVHFVTHPKADIAVGMLGRVVNHSYYSRVPVIASSFQLSMRPLNNGDDVQTFAFPQTKDKYLSETEQLFTFKGKWSSGKVIDYHADGSPLVRNACYQTSMEVLDGASGGPVMKGNYVIGVNSSGMTVEEGEEPISFITPITYLDDLKVPITGGFIPVKQLIKEGQIIVGS